MSFPASAASLARGHSKLLFAALMLGTMSQALTFSALPPALPQMAQDFGRSGAFVAQMTMSLAALGLVVGALASGWILEKAGTRVTLLTSLTIYAVCGSSGLVLRDAAWLLAMRFAVGFAAACLTTTCVWGIAAEYTGDRRARVMGYSCSAATILAVGSTVIGGWLARGGWRLAFLLYPVLGLLGFLLAFASVGQVKPMRENAVSVDGSWFKRLLPVYLLAMLLYAVMFMEAAQFSFLLQDDGMSDSATRALVIGTITTVASATGLFYGTLQQRLGLIGTLTVGLSCMAVALAMVGWTVHPAYAVLGAALMGINDGLVGPYLYHVVAEYSDGSSRSWAIGLLSAFSFFGGFLNPIAMEPMRSAIGLRNSFLVVALIMAVLSTGTAFRWAFGRGAAPERAVSRTPV